MAEIKHEPNIHDYPWLLEATGIDPNTLGAVMLPVLLRDGLVEHGFAIGLLSRDDLHVSDNPERFWIKGDVSNDAHITLLYGLLTPAYEQEDLIHRLMSDWTRPAWLPITGYEAFPSPFEDEPYACIVARIGDQGGALAAARGLLEYLPHVNTFPEYKSHATIAYVKPEAAEAWLAFLQRGPKVVEVPAVSGMRQSLDLGSAK